MLSTGSNADRGIDYGRAEPVEPDKLRNLGVDREYCARFALGRNSVALNIVEFFDASRHFPIAFSRSNARVMPCALLGLADGDNLFVDGEGHWREGVYLPACIRRYPFITSELADADDDSPRPICVDPAALCDHAPPLFDRNGIATDRWREIELFNAEYLTAERATLAFTARLAKFELLESFDARVYPHCREPLSIGGLYRVNENRLNRLAPKALAELMELGELSRIYAHLISLDNFAKLLDLSSQPSS